MKYLKTFEGINSDLRYLLVDFLQKNKTNNFSVTPNLTVRDKKSEALSLNSTDARKNRSWLWDNNLIVLSIRISPINDKQLRNAPIKTKLKINFNCAYDTTGVADQNFLDILIEYLTIIFKKYSYFNKVSHHTYNGKLKQNYELFINVSDIDNIMKDLEDFEMYKDMRKYNI